jgi:hypothetical protein
MKPKASVAKAVKLASKETATARDFSPLYDKLLTAKSVCQLIENAAAGAPLAVDQDGGTPIHDTDYVNLAKLLNGLIAAALDCADELKHAQPQEAANG